MSQIHALRQLFRFEDVRRINKYERQTIESANIALLLTLDEQSAHALLEGTRCNRRTISSGVSSATTFLFRYDGVPEFRASPGLDSIVP